MKILHLIDTLALGGAQSMLKGVLENQQDNHHLFLYALRTSDEMVAIHHPNVIICSSHSRYALKPIREIKKIIRDHNIDVLHCHLPRSQFTGFLLKKCWFKKMKLVFHEHGDIFENSNILPFVLKRAQSKVDLHFCVSDATRDMLLKKTGAHREKVVRLYNFVDLNYFRPDAINPYRADERSRLAILPSQFTFGFAGRLIERKGWREFLHAVAILKTKVDLRCIIAGNGIDASLITKEIERLGLQDTVHVIGFCKNMLRFYAAIDCFVIPSHWEPMGLTEIEAMALKIPVIAANVPGLNEVVQDRINGLLFPPKNTASLAKVMQEIMENASLRNELIQEASVSVTEYSYPVFATQLEQRYKELEHENG